MDEQVLTKKQRKELNRQARADSNERAQKSAALRRALIWGGAILAIGLILWLLIKNGGGDSASAPVSANLQTVAADDWTLGNIMATATLIEYSDLECPACAAAEPFVKQVVKDYGAKVRVVYRHFPLAQHPHSLEAARAAEAAGAQGQFWPMHDLLFGRQRDWSPLGAVWPVFKSYAEELKLDLAKFEADYNSKEIKDKIKRQEAGGLAAGVDSTPTFFLNGRKLQLTSFNDIVNAVAMATK